MTGIFGMAFDPTFSIRDLLEVGSMVGGGILVVVALRTDVRSLKEVARGLSDRIDGMQAELKRLGDVLIDLANVRGEINVIRTRQTTTEQDVRELRHGDGFIQGRRGIDREYK